MGVGRFGGPGGSGSSDILWHDIDGTKELQIWFMDGHRWVDARPVVNKDDQTVKVGPPGWHVVGVGDFGGSSTNGILWHDIDGTKELQIWLMDRHKWVDVRTVVNDQDQTVTVGPPGWHVKGVRGTMHHLPAPCVQTGIIHTDYRLNFKIPPATSCTTKQHQPGKAPTKP